MRGEFMGVCVETWRGIWLPLIDYEDVPEDIFCDLYRELGGRRALVTSVETVYASLDDLAGEASRNP